MLKAIVAKVVRAAANARRVGCALAEEIRGDARAASLVAVKKAVGAAFCGVATVIFLAPASFLAVNDAAAQQICADPADEPTPTCALQCRVNAQGGNTSGCGSCSDGYVEVDGVCQTPKDCSAISGQVPSDDNTECVCEQSGDVVITDTCQNPEAFCQGQQLSVLETFQELPNPTVDEARGAYCSQCPGGANYERISGNCQLVKDCSTESPHGRGLFRGQFLDRENQNNECVCPSGQEILPDPDEFLLRAKEQSDVVAGGLGAKVCAPALPDYANTYNGSDCEDAGWEVTYWAVTVAAQGQPQGGFNLVESCEIPVEFYAGAMLTVLSTVTGETEIRPVGDSMGNADSCVLRRNMSADVAAAVGGNNMRFCDNAELFGTAGLPKKPDSLEIREKDRLLIVSTITAENMSIRISYEKQPVLPVGAAPVAPSDPGGPTTTDPTTLAVSGGGSGGGGGGAGPAAGGGILLLALAYYAFSGHDSGASFAFTPQASYAIENDLESYRYGSRLEFRQDEWTLWWAANEKSSGGGKSLNYGYGGQWSNDVLRASAGVNYGESHADMRAGLEAEWTLSNWTIRPAYRFSAVSDEGEWNVKNGLDLTAQMTQAGWTVRPSMNAGLWSGNSLDADLGLQVGREF